MMCQSHCNIHGEELKKKTIRCSDDVSIPLQYPWQSAEKEEKKVQPNLYAMHAKCVIIIPRDIQLACNIYGKDLIAHPKTRHELLSLIVDDDKPADETIIITSEDDIIITDNEIKR